jgi:5-methylcytosine-specific restriction endonuclease McrA
MSKRSRITDEERRQRQREANARYRANHPERVKAIPRSQLPPEKVAQLRARDREAKRRAKERRTPEQIAARKAYDRARYLREHDRFLEAARLKRERDPEKHREGVRRSAAKRRARDPEGDKRRQAQATARWRARNPEKAREIVKAVQRRHEARKRGAQRTEAVRLRILAERDGWRCHICGKLVTKKNWSMDHLVPISKGGDHTYDNVSLAHVSCNGRRQDGRTPAQLLFIG